VIAKLKKSAKWFSARSGALRLASQFGPPGAAILMYHSIRDDPERHANSIGAGILHATSVFARQMELVARRFTPVTVADIGLFLEQGKPLPPRAVAVTFDDGYIDNAEIAAPILNRFGIRGSFYLTVNLIGAKDAPWFCRLRHAFSTTQRREWISNGRSKPLTAPHERNAALLSAFDSCASLAGENLEHAVQALERELEVKALNGGARFMMDWDQARDLSRAGHIVGCHTLTHPNVAQVAAGVAQQELVASKQRLEAELRGSVLHFSYPHPALNPHWTATTVAITKEAGYQTAVTTTPGPVRIGDHALSLTRIWTPRSEQEFLWNLECAFLRRWTRAAA
jgi:peptidoglycan/xylan/chitin deacetylase (PgdA/CDA1 family)